MARQVAMINRTAILIALLVFTFLGVCGLVLSFLLPIPYIKTAYGLMVDAGSSKSEIRIYQWDHRDDSSIPKLEEAPSSENPYSFRVEPGISSYSGNPDGLRESMQALLDYAIEKVPAEQHSFTPLYLKATAGMRILPIEEQEEILAVIREVFSNSPFRFEDDWATVISGQEEGVFGWLTVNHLTGKLTSYAPLETFGALDLGGASTQITFVPGTPATLDNYTLQLDKDSYELFSKSYLYYGSDQARFAFNQSLIPLGPPEALDDPCLHTGYDLADATFEFEGQAYTLVGSSSYATCESLIISSLFSDGKFIPPSSELRGLFYAFAGFVYTPQFFNLPPDASIEMIRQEGIKYCNLSWEGVKQVYPDVQPRYLANYCFNSAYIVAILETAYGFDPHARGEITFMSEIMQVNLDWTMGAILYEVSNLEEIREPTKLLFKTFFGVVTILISAFFLLLALAMFLFFRSSKKSIEEGQRLLEPT